MIGYTMVGTKDLDRSRRFYDPLFMEMGQELCFSDDQSASWGKSPTRLSLDSSLDTHSMGKRPTSETEL